MTIETVFIETLSKLAADVPAFACLIAFGVYAHRAIVRVYKDQVSQGREDRAALIELVTENTEAIKTTRSAVDNNTQTLNQLLTEFLRRRRA